ncbi:MAG TPA: response regulator transcription factor, partial [Tepidisphaeraceae bacterium]|nr:response regulator transcription factor [Tepidisphaeraceae bacterium]
MNTALEHRDAYPSPETPVTGTIRVLLADDHHLLRQGLRALIAGEQGMTVVGEADDGRAAVAMATELDPDIVVMDVSMPDLNGVDATMQMRRQGVRARVIGLSMHNDRQRVQAMLAAGASGYLVKDCVFDELATAVRAVAAGQTYVSPRVAGGVVDAAVGNGVAPGGGARVLSSPVRALSPREREVLQLMAEGRATKEIASDLKVSVKTVETHRRQLMEKLNLFSVAELTKYAVREGLTTLEG